MEGDLWNSGSCGHGVYGCSSSPLCGELLSKLLALLVLLCCWNCSFLPRQGETSEGGVGRGWTKSVGRVDRVKGKHRHVSIVM